MYAAKFDYSDIAKDLIVSGADLNAKDKAGKTALQYAQEKGYANIINLLAPK